MQRDTVFLAGVFESFQNKCIEKHEIDPAYFLSAPGLASEACLKKAEVELELLADVDMLLLVEIGIKHCIKHRNLTQFSGVEILWKCTISLRVSHKFPKTL